MHYEVSRTHFSPSWMERPNLRITRRWLYTQRSRVPVMPSRPTFPLSLSWLGVTILVGYCLFSWSKKQRGSFFRRGNYGHLYPLKGIRYLFFILTISPYVILSHYITTIFSLTILTRLYIFRNINKLIYFFNSLIRS